MGDGGTTTAATSEAQAWHAMDADEVVEALGTGADGLDDATAGQRLEESGPNRLVEDSGPSKLTILINQFRGPLIAILAVAGVVAALLGEHIDAGFIAAVLVINAGIGFIQEAKAEASIRALMELAAPNARVVRDGEEQEIEAEEIVPGDIVVLDEGAKVPADLRLTEASRLKVDESLLTGESSAARKTTEPVEEDAPVADRTCMAFMGSVVAGGNGRGVAVATGMDTELGGIAEDVQSEEQPTTPIQQRLERFSKLIAIAVSVASTAIFAWGWLTGMDLTEVFLLAVALAVSAVPEGLPVAFTVALALGVRRMAERDALIRRLPAVETLGSTTTIASDKTGTLTQNRMTVEELWTPSGRWELDDESFVAAAGADGEGDRLDPEAHPAVRTILEAGALTNEAKLAEEEDEEAGGDATEIALLLSAERAGIDIAALREEHQVVVAVPFDPSLLYSAAVVEDDDGYLLVVKGATEELLEHATAMRTDEGDTDLDAEAIREVMEDMAEKGLRVLAMAVRRLDEPPADADDLDVSDLVFCGLQGMMDPPREHVLDSIEACQQAGVRVVMVTGDHAKTARAIAGMLGIEGDQGAVLTGQEVEELSDSELEERVAETAVFARMSPEHKLRVVHALQDKGEVAAVTGDGVNDAPALKAAEIGVAMGESGTDVAREASDMVLTDDDFESIRDAVEEGRTTFDNVRKVTFFLVVTGASEVLIIMTAFVLGSPIPLVPAQILWLNLVTNGLQDVALAFEPGDEGVLELPPRSIDEGLLSRTLWERTAIVAVVMAAVTLWMFWWSLDTSDSLTQAQTAALTTLVVLSAVQVYTSRSEHHPITRLDPLGNRFLLLAQVGALLVHVGALYLPITQTILRVEPLPSGAWLRMALAGGLVLVVNEVHKRIRQP